MALNIKDVETERLAAEVSALAQETKTRAVQVALLERRDRLASRVAPQAPGARLRRFLEEEAWPQIPLDVLGVPISRDDREAILGYGTTGA